jgi:hypothetical protein
MMMWDKKRAMETIMRRRKASGEHPPAPATEMKNEDMMADGGEIDGRHEAAKDILHAHNVKSPEMLMHALINFMDIHMAHGDADKPEPAE